jgi:hypothetical protein
MMTVAALGFGALAAGAAMAEAVDTATARAMLFAPTGMVFHPVAPVGLDEAAVAKVTALQDGLASQMAGFEAAGFGYYGALAVPQGVGLTPESLIMTQGLHSPEAAQVTVLAQCKEAHATECTLVGLTLPAGYKAQDLTLSAAATGTFVDSVADGGGPRVLAYSPSTAASALVKGSGAAAETAALEACNKGAGEAADCVIGVSD